MMQKQEQDFGVLKMIIKVCIAASRTEEGNVDYHLYKGKTTITVQFGAKKYKKALKVKI